MRSREVITIFVVERKRHIFFLAILLLALLGLILGFSLTSSNNASPVVHKHKPVPVTTIPPVPVTTIPISISTTTVPPTTTTTAPLTCAQTPGCSPPTTAPPVTTPPTTAPPAPVPSTPSDVVAEWSKVNVCEESGNWGYAGPAYPDGLGIDAANWDAYNTAATINDLSIANQIRVAQDIMAAAGEPGVVPDQNGCDSW